MRFTCLFQDIFAVGINGMLAQEQLFSDLFTIKAIIYQPDDLKFTIRENMTRHQQFLIRISEIGKIVSQVIMTALF